jgi:hypothetical protein
MSQVTLVTGARGDPDTPGGILDQGTVNPWTTGLDQGSRVPGYGKSPGLFPSRKTPGPQVIGSPTPGEQVFGVTHFTRDIRHRKTPAPGPRTPALPPSPAGPSCYYLRRIFYAF